LSFPLWQVSCDIFVELINNSPVEFNNYVSIEINEKELFYRTNKLNMYLRKKDGHHGNAYHSYWAEKFLKEYLKDEIKK
jgi:hypothetical protein